MKINSLFSDVSEISIEEYLFHCGISNPTQYIKAKTLEEPTNYDNIEEAKSLILKYINSNIYILTDCDVDGFFSASLLYIFIKRLNPNANIIPMIHKTKIHGLADKDILSWLITQPKGLIITPDSSVGDVNECKQLSELGFEILIGGEHHLIEKENPYAIIVSNQIGSVKNRNGSGGLVTWQMCKHVNKTLVQDLISYVAISLIGDSMDMTEEENFTFAKWGKERIHPYLKPFVKELNRDGDSKITRSYSFGLITCINSTIRLGEMEDKYELFKALCGEIDPFNIIEKCKAYHTQQSNQSSKMMDNVDIISDGKVLIARLYEKTAMTGLVAGKLMSKYNKPVLLGYDNDGEISGSVRSPIDLKDVLSDSGLTNFQAGHHRSFGFGYPSDSEQRLIDYLDNVLVDCEPLQDVLISSTVESLPISLFSFTEEHRHIFAKGLDTYMVHIQPFTINSSSIKILGANKRTLKITYENVDFMLFNVSNNTKERLHIGESVDLKFECIGELGLNFYMGRTKKQVLVDKFEVEVVEEEDIWSTIWE